MFAIALLLGALTVYLTRNFIQNQRKAEPIIAVEQQQTELATVVVANIPMKFGDELTAEKLRVVSWPADIRPEGSFENIADIIGTDRRVVLRSLGNNEPVTKDKISGFGSRASLSQVIEEGYRATSIRVNDIISVAGFILPGDRVDVLLTFDEPGTKKKITRIIFQDMRVLAIDQLSDEAQGGAVLGKSATLEVTPEEAQKIALASRIGSLSLTLRRMEPEGENIDVIQTRTVNVYDLKPSTGVAVKKPEPKKTGGRRYVRPKVAVKKPVNPWGEMKVTRGLKESTEKVLVEEELEKSNDPVSLEGATPLN
jgi:pilus assembly protein CpaB